MTHPQTNQTRQQSPHSQRSQTRLRSHPESCLQTLIQTPSSLTQTHPTQPPAHSMLTHSQTQNRPTDRSEAPPRSNRQSSVTSAETPPGVRQTHPSCRNEHADRPESMSRDPQSSSTRAPTSMMTTSPCEPENRHPKMKARGHPQQTRYVQPPRLRQ